MTRHRDTRRRVPPAALAGAAAALLLLWFAAAGAADPAGAGDPDLDRVRTLFHQRWLAGDHDALAGMVVERGALISLARDDRTARSATPGRARYVFKTLFLATEEHALETVAVSAGESGDVVHTVLEWSFLRGGLRQTDRLFVTWTREPAGWRLAELRTGR